SSRTASPPASTTCGPWLTRRSVTACSSTSRARRRASRPIRSSTRSSRPCPRARRRRLPPPEPTERATDMGLLDVLPWRRDKKAVSSKDDDLFDDKFQRKLEYLALVSRRVFAGRLRAERRTKKSG